MVPVAVFISGESKPMSQGCKPHTVSPKQGKGGPGALVFHSCILCFEIKKGMSILFGYPFGVV